MAEDILTTLISDVGRVGLWLQALGIAIVAAFIFDVIAFFYNRKRMQEVYRIKEDMKRIESKIDKIMKKV
ncbi:hypothetical protein KW805_02275 [Candidatus Pacearchaeota archaeon]|nr:hypothetical protein [Candidatus Pacearchaeota archaeon]